MSRSRDSYPWPKGLTKHGTSVCYCWMCRGMRGPSRAKDAHARKLKKAAQRDAADQVADYAKGPLDPRHPEYNACAVGECNCEAVA